MPINQIPLDQFMDRCHAFFHKHPTEYVRIEAHDVTEMFLLHNDKCSPNESGKSCSTCRGRVYRRLKTFYESIIKNNTQ